ncbi:MAG: metallophosphoesterase [Acinetobacter ursingii]|uniref:metallophosphoesterase n=1 Tax=Acinetobacter ursingii TaxID=108980 RepID=UPI0012500A19|nr:metallophosphoesterase [Acinetobacter ursingii]
MWDFNSIIFYFYLIFVVLAIWAVSQAWRSQACTETIHPFKAFVHLLVFYLSYLLFPLIVFSVYAGWSGYFSLHQSIFIFLLSLFLTYARFIEPHLVHVRQHQYRLNPNQPFAKSVKVALIADLHVGLYSGHERQLRIIVEKLNQAQPDIVVVAGDWTYEPEHKLAEELQVLRQIQAPVYSVPGNHDEQYPGPPIQELLKHALDVNDVIDIEGKIVEFDEFRLIGIGDLWAGKTDMRFMPELPQDKPWLILSHNPDTVDMVPELPSRPLMLSGHTHGGQVELPWLTNYIMKKVSILGHKKGFYEHEHADVFVTVGTGMVGVPFRFRVPPTIDIIELI